MKRLSLTTVGLVVVVGLGAYAMRRPANDAKFLTAPISQGDVARTVVAKGTIEPLHTVKVGSQVSGVISDVTVDYNSVVHKGQVLARLDPALAQAQVNESRAAVAEAQDAVEAEQVLMDAARVTLGETDALAKRNILAESDREDAQVAYDEAVADVRSKMSAVTESKAELDQALVDLSNSTITSPIDGIVVARDVDAGQTVAARLNAPTLFDIAEDLTHLKVEATIDESDIGLIRQGQPAVFTVDAYPGRRYTGVVEQVRQGPDAIATAPAAVTYTTVINISNADLSLRPGMTATLNIEAARHSNALRVTPAALEWMPTLALFKRLKMTVPAEYADAERTRTRAKSGATGYLWYQEGPGLRAIKVTTGLTDGVVTEVSAPGLSAGKLVITGESGPH